MSKRGLNATPAIADGKVFISHGEHNVDTNKFGRVQCLDAKTGKHHWTERVGGDFTASPLYANGHVYFFDQKGKTTVVKANKKFTKVGENLLDAGFMASPAVSGNALFLRTKAAIYRIEP